MVLEEPVLDWFVSFLSDRYQTVQIVTFYSSNVFCFFFSFLLTNQFLGGVGVAWSLSRSFGAVTLRSMALG